MSARKSISVSRTYRHEPDNCLHALITLLRKPVRKMNVEPSPEPDVRNDGIEVESRVEERMRLEIEAMLDVLEKKLTREEFIKVARVVVEAGADGA